ncbi:MAG: HAD family hydrolase [Micrococcaceae bacterium]
MLIALDIDGTVIDYDERLSDKQKIAIQGVIADGHEVVFATGRSMAATLPIIKEIGLKQGYAVACNGAVTFSYSHDKTKIIEQVTFNPERALKALQEVLPQADYAVETKTGDILTSTSFLDRSFGQRVFHVPFEELSQQEVTRLVVRSSQIPKEDFTHAIESIGLHGVSYAVGWNAWLDIAPEGVTKASSLEILRRKLGVDPADTLAVGDGENDVEMLQWAARGVAMGQAGDLVRDAAHELTGTIDEDGLAQVLNSLSRKSVPKS